MLKKELDILENVFSAEINADKRTIGRLFQTKSKVAADLASRDYLEEVEIIDRGSVAVKIKGYVLTPKGHLAYCESCGYGA